MHIIFSIFALGKSKKWYIIYPKISYPSSEITKFELVHNRGTIIVVKQVHERLKKCIRKK